MSVVALASTALLVSVSPVAAYTPPGLPNNPAGTPCGNGSHEVRVVPGSDQYISLGGSTLRLQIRYSPYCHTAWTRVYNYGPVSITDVTEIMAVTDAPDLFNSSKYTIHDWDAQLWPKNCSTESNCIGSRPWLSWSNQYTAGPGYWVRPAVSLTHVAYLTALWVQIPASWP
jgi:hypothetical protein